MTRFSGVKSDREDLGSKCVFADLRENDIFICFVHLQIISGKQCELCSELWVWFSIINTGLCVKQQVCVSVCVCEAGSRSAPLCSVSLSSFCFSHSRCCC